MGKREGLIRAWSERRANDCEIWQVMRPGLKRAARVREVHALAISCLCDGMDAQLFGEQETSL